MCQLIHAAEGIIHHEEITGSADQQDLLGKGIDDHQKVDVGVRVVFDLLAILVHTAQIEDKRPVLTVFDRFGRGLGRGRRDGSRLCVFDIDQDRRVVKRRGAGDHNIIHKTQRIAEGFLCLGIHRQRKEALADGKRLHVAALERLESVGNSWISHGLNLCVESLVDLAERVVGIELFLAESGQRGKFIACHVREAFCRVIGKNVDPDDRFRRILRRRDHSPFCLLDLVQDCGAEKKCGCEDQG